MRHAQKAAYLQAEGDAWRAMRPDVSCYSEDNSACHKYQTMIQFVCVTLCYIINAIGRVDHATGDLD